MRLILGLTLILCQIYSAAQKILSTCDELLTETDFTDINGNWEQKSTETDFFITEKGNYILKNKSEFIFSISQHQPALDLEKFKIEVSMKADAGGSENSLGIVFNARNDGTGAMVFEVNSKRQYRIRKFVNGQWESLTFSNGEGWLKSKLLKKKDFNVITLMGENGLFDLYINNAFVASYEDKILSRGNLGFFVNQKSSGRVDFIKIYKERTVVDTLTKRVEPKHKDEPAFTENEVIMLLKAKIDKQQKKIELLSSDLEKCNTLKSGDTSLPKKYSESVQLNETLLIEKGKLEVELKAAKETLEEYSMLKKNLEKENNGDIILKLSDIINREKQKNKDLEQEISSLRKENEELKKSNRDK